MARWCLKSELLFIATLGALLFVHSATGAQDLDGDKQLGGRIINGTLATLNGTKHQVSIRRRVSDRFYFGSGHICGGSLIEPNVVLSAAHCFVNQDINNGSYRSAADFTVVMGTLDRFQRSPNTLQFDIEQIVYGIDIFNTSTYENDIALVFLNDSVPAGHPTIEAIARARTAVAAGTVCQATGWGRTEKGNLATNLLSVDLPIIDVNECIAESNFAPGLVREGMLCAGYISGEQDACDGDSGGPLVCNTLLTGIVSWGIGCAQPRLPGVYTDVAYWYNWIDNVTESNRKADNSTAGGNSTTGGNSTSPNGNGTSSGNSTGGGGSGGVGGGGGGGAMSNLSHSAVMLVMIVAWTTLMSYFN
ncbi:trypsin eta-like [Anastrepha obliqua]|uniref:trypsin eta-like n=1 Tax=Anastrepha obliqua TaxID=95512 RepID=UPI00240A8122|nr:trypsin eta-like [Anastrepha obliqua]